MEQIKDLVVAAQKFQEKRTWLRKGASDLLVSIQLALEGIPAPEEWRIEYKIHEWSDENYQGGAINRWITLDLYSCKRTGKIYVELQTQSNDPYTSSKEISANGIGFGGLRALIQKLPAALEFFKSELEERDAECDELLAALQKIQIEGAPK